MTTGTVIITGANSSLGTPAVSYLLLNYPASTVILTVRDDSERDANTAKLRAIIAQNPPNANVLLRKLDLASLTAVHNFTDEIRSEIIPGKIPRLLAVVWNAMSWTLQGGLQFTSDGYERSIAINHIAQFAMTLRLLEVFDSERGRINLDLLVHPLPDKEDEVVARGFQRYGLSKLVMVMFMYELNKQLKKSKHFGKVSALAVDPGGLLDSRAFSIPDVPWMWSTQVRIANLLQPLLKILHPSFRRSADAAEDVMEIAVGPQYAGQEGYFIIDKKANSSCASKDVEMQSQLWKKSLEWAEIRQEDTILPLYAGLAPGEGHVST